MTEPKKKTGAGRREAAGDPVTVTHGDHIFTLPVELPFEVAARISSGSPYEMKLALDRLLGDAADTLWAMSPSVEAIGSFIEQVLEAYGMDTGNSAASPES